jgi:hypothetical protein
MATVVAYTNEDLAIPYSNKKQLLSTYEIAINNKFVANKHQ